MTPQWDGNGAFDESGFDQGDDWLLAEGHVGPGSIAWDLVDKAIRDYINGRRDDAAIAESQWRDELKRLGVPPEIVADWAGHIVARQSSPEPDDFD